MKLAVTILAIIAVIAGAISEWQAKGDDFAGWGVIFAGAALILLENF